ncbi:hypothetical protein [Cytobacillus praedii]|uniref:Uncharacterized protein n=1 Tax=Cytobacillus praedii TaxID=1742358 RepID=A0A4R1AWY3_9BACI|nr:hypothetical protein [Cytobacillus praedii]TCJ02085.1 hypothetical protein E0Y62_21005 [Cytobacillus praedii]
MGAGESLSGLIALLPGGAAIAGIATSIYIYLNPEQSSVQSLFLITSVLLILLIQIILIFKKY